MRQHSEKNNATLETFHNFFWKGRFYMPICKQIMKGQPKSNWLLSFARNVTSQRGEDGILEKIFEILPNSNKFSVEFGAWDGKKLSNTWNLVENHKWRCLYIEANENRFNELQKNHGNNSNVICMNKFVEFEGDNNLDNLLDSVNFPLDLDLISIDIDGNDWHIWDSLKKFQPKIVIIEFNQSIPNDIIYVQDKDFLINQGCSLSALIQLGKEKGYELIATTSWNGFFVKAEYYKYFKIEDNSIDNMYSDTKFGTKIFQLYDGTLVLSGVKKLFWHDISIDNDDIQVLPKSLRKYPDHISDQKTRSKSLDRIQRPPSRTSKDQKKNKKN